MVRVPFGPGLASQARLAVPLVPPLPVAFGSLRKSGSARLRAGPSSLGFSGPLFAHFASPLAAGPLPLRGSASARRARSRFAGPVRRLRPAFGLRARPRAVPPGFLSAGPAVGFAASPGLRAGPDCLRPRLRVAAGSLFGRPCFARPWALCSAWPRGFLSPRPFGLRGLSSSLRSSAAAPAPGPLAALRPPFSGLWPRGLLAARVLASACWAALAVLPGVLPRCLGFACSRWLCCAALAPAGARCSAAPRRAPFSPAPLPSPPPPLGTPGRRKAQRVGFAPRSVGRASRAPLAAPPGGLIARPLR